jgi:hypothetical protein
MFPLTAVSSSFSTNSGEVEANEVDFPIWLDAGSGPWRKQISEK